MSPDRLAIINNNDPYLINEIGQPALQSIDFFNILTEHVAPKILNAVSAAANNPEMLIDAKANYRIVDYYSRSKQALAPRCGEHIDYGTFTLIFTNE